MKAYAALLALLLASQAAASVFSDVSAVTGGKSANLSWTTSAQCSSQLLYGLTQSYGKTKTSSAKKTVHALSVTGLEPYTVYHYQLKCKVNNTLTAASEDYTFKTLEALPDLQMTRLTATPQAAASDKKVKLKAYVRNGGDGKASNVALDIQCPNGSVVRKNIASVNAGASASAEAECAPPANPGQYPVSASADPANLISEKDEGNNQAQETVTYAPQPKPDLELSEADITHSMTETGGLYITFKVYVHNLGSAKASAVKLRVAGGIPTAVKTIPSISAHSKGLTTATVLLTANNSFTFTADPDNEIAEEDETNNVATYRRSGSLLPDLAIRGGDVTHTPAAPKTGSSVILKAKVYNNGSTTAQNVKVTFIKVVKSHAKEEDVQDGQPPGPPTKPGAQLPAEGQTIGEKTIASMAPGSSATAQVTYVIPPDTASVPVAVVLDRNNRISEDREDNNQAFHTFTADVLYPDFAVNASQITFNPAAPKAGDALTITAKVRNLGTLAGKNVPVRFTVRRDGGPETTLADKTLPTISSKGASNAQVQWQVPSGVNSLEFAALANPLKTIPEKDYGNNGASRSLDVSMPDLEVTGKDITATGAVSVGSQVTLKADIVNSGSADAANAAVHFIWVLPSGTEASIASKALTVPANTVKSASVQWTVPNGVPTAPVILVRVNEAHAIPESDYANNQGTVTLNADLPDLTVSLAPLKPTAVIPSAQGYYGPVSFKATVRNGGTAAARNFAVAITNESGKTVKEETIGSLNPGQNATVLYGYNTRPGMQPGEYSYTATADPQGAVTESVEDNNADDASVTLVRNQPPSAVARANQTTAAKRAYIGFDCLGSTDPDSPNPSSPAIYCGWSFGDGGNPEDAWYSEGGKVADYRFTSSGAYTVRVNVTDNMGASDTDTVQVSITGNLPPVADAGEALTVYKGEESYFSPLASADPDGDIVSVAWNFGDGATETSGFESVPHTYQSTGTKTLRITVTDDSGAASADTTTVNVINPPPMTTKTGSEVFISHTYHSPWASGPQAEARYGLYKVDYTVKYTNDGVLKYVKYAITSGAAIVTAVTDNDAESLYLDVTAIAANGRTGLDVTGVEVRENGGALVWEASGGPHVSGSEPTATMTYSDINVPFDPSKHNFVNVQSAINYPGQMCAAEQYSCQNQAALYMFT
jgi:subtilase family serine protease